MPRSVQSVLYRELLVAARQLARAASSVPRSSMVHTRALEHARGWHARVFPHPFTAPEHEHMLRTCDLAPMAAVEPLIKTAFRVDNPLPIDAGFGMLRQLRKLRRWFEYSRRWQVLLSESEREEPSVENGLELIAAMRGDRGLTEAAEEINASLDELAAAVRAPILPTCAVTVLLLLAAVVTPMQPRQARAAANRAVSDQINPSGHRRLPWSGRPTWTKRWRSA